MAATGLGPGGSLPIGTTNPIEIPQSEAPEKVLRNDPLIPLPPLYNNGIVESFKVLSGFSDSTPGYLSEKINTNQFSIVSNKIELYSLVGLDTDSLEQGSVNFYLNQSSFDTFFGSKNTDELPVGVTNLYYTSLLFDSDFSTKTTDNLNEGAVNKYMSVALLGEIADNTTARHSHLNKSLLDSYSNSNSSITTTIALSHDHSNKSILDATEESFTSDLKIKYDNFESGAITSVLSPLVLNSGVLSHSALDGNKHVPSNASANQYNVLASGTNAGDYAWSDIETILANSTVFEEMPSTSTTKGVQSAYLNTHVTNGTADVNHLSNSQVSYLDTTIPNHIASLTKHVPDFTSANNGMFLYVNSSSNLDWSSSAINITISGESYLTASGSTITAGKVGLAQTSISAGSNISFNGDQISADQRAITSTSTSGDTTTSISASWAYSHENTFGSTGHIPGSGTLDQYIAGDGTLQDWSSSPGAVYKITMAAGGPTGDIATRLASSTFPTDWSGSIGATTTDLIITHTALNEVVDVTIFTDDGTDVTKLIATAAYSTIITNQEMTSIKIASLATINELIYIYIKFL